MEIDSPLPGRAIIDTLNRAPKLDALLKTVQCKTQLSLSVVNYEHTSASREALDKSRQQVECVNKMSLT